MNTRYIKKQVSETTIYKAGILISLLITVLIAASVHYASGQIDPLEYPPGHPNVTVSATEQLKTFPVPRFKQGHTFLPNFNWMDPIWFGSRWQSGVSDAQAVTNSVDIQTELAKNFNYYVNVSWSGDNFNTAWKNLANANPQYKVGLITFRAQVGGTKIWDQNLPAANYLQNSSGQFIDANGSVTSNKVWRPTAPISSYTQDGQSARGYIQSALSGLTNSVDMVNENGEVFYIYSNSAMGSDPQVTAAKNSSGLDWETFLAQKVKENDQQAYRDQFMNLSQLSGAKFSEYRMDGHREWNFRWEQMRYISTPINGQYYSTSDFYVRWPNNWKDWQGPWHGLRWMTESRHYEIAAGDKLFSPFIAAGWDDNPEVDVRPAQWLGLLKLLNIYGAEFFYTGFFNESFSQSNPPPNPKGYAWQAVIPAYAQAASTRYEDIMRNGSLLPGDMVDVAHTPDIPYYQFNTGASNKVVAIRKMDTANKYAITGTIQNNSNVIGSTPLTADASITLYSQNLQFKIRRQGSTYIYDNTNPSAPVFYQLDEWHEATHPYRWSQDFNLEAELYDNTNAAYTIKTTVPAGTASGDFRNFTSFITFPDAQTTFTPIEYVFEPRSNTTNTLYFWVRARSRNGQATGMSVSVDNGTAKSIGCISDTNWTWYRLDACSQQAISFASLSLNDHTLRITPTSNKLDIDKIILAVSSSFAMNPQGPVCSSGGTASVTANGPLTFCQGGSVTLTASSGNSYLWSNGATSQSITVSASGTYTVSVNNGTGCAGVSAPQVVTVVAPPSATITPNGPITFCQGGSVVLTSSPGNSYLWTPGGATTQSISVSNAGNYTVKVTNSTGCSATSAPLTVTVTTGSSATISANGPTTFCQGGSVTLTSSSGSSYLWSNGASTQAITVNTNGNYIVQVTSGGCTATSNPTTVTVNPNPSATITPDGATTFCQGGNVHLTANSANSYQWTPGGQTTQQITVTSSGTYTVKTTNSSGCTALSALVNVIVNPNPTATVSANGPTTFCQGGSVTLTSSAGASYLWTPGNQTTQSVLVSSSGNYSVKVTNSSGCSATSSSQNVTVNVPAVPVITPSGSTTINQGQTVTLTASAGASYLWTPGGQTTQSITVGTAGNYRVTVTYSNGCSAISGVTTVTVNNSTPVAITLSGSNSICQGDSILLTASAGYSYLWLPGGQTSQSIYAAASGVYTVQASNGTSAQVTIIVNDKPMIPSITITYIPNSAYQLTAYEPSAVSYLWSNGMTTQTINVSSPQTVAVRAINNFGCAGGLQNMIVAAPVAQPCAKANMLTSYDIIDVAATVAWNPAITADSFMVSGAPQGFGTAFNRIVAGNVSNVHIDGLVAGTMYNWSVKTFCSSGTQTSFNASFTTLSGPLNCGSTPINLSTTNITESSAKLNWYNTTAQKFKVRYKILNASSYTYKTIDANSNPNSTLIGQLPSSMTFEWSVQAICNGSPSLFAPKQYFTTFPACPFPGPVEAQDVVHNRAVIQWNGIAPVDTIKIKYGVVGSTSFLYKGVVQAGSLGRTTIYYLQPNTNYYLLLRSKCYSGGRSEWSDTVFFHTLPIPQPRVETPDNLLQLNAYPNPAHDRIQFAFVSGEDSEYSVKVTDMAGRELIKQVRYAYSGENGDNLNLSGFTSGMYMLVVEQGPMSGRFKFSIH